MSQRIAYDDLCRVVTAIFAGLGLPSGDAALVAESLIGADLRGAASHGIIRIPVYAERLRRGGANPTPSLAIEEATPVAARIDGDGGMGFVVGARAMDEAVARARIYGVGLVLARRSSHFGMSMLYLERANRAGFAAVVLTNASPTMPVWGGRTPFLGTSPLAMSAPGGKTPLMLDMATSVAAKGKIRVALERGEPIPEGWALDTEGRPTTDAQAGIDGVVLPLGGPKGSGLSLMMEAFAGVMAGAAFGGQVPSIYEAPEQRQDTGHLFLAIKPDLFMPRAEYDARMDALVGRAKASPLADGFDEILMPGERGARQAAKAKAEGLLVSATNLAMLAAEAAKVGAPGL